MDLESNSNVIFSEDHPRDLLERIIADGVTQSTYENVYRISESGECNRDAFLCTAIENSQRNANNRDAYLAEKQKEYKIDDWSTSCWNNFDKALEIYECKEKHGHSPAILKGNISLDSGYSLLTTERLSVKEMPANKRKTRNHHIDWWIFVDKDVSTHFEVMEV